MQYNVIIAITAVLATFSVAAVLNVHPVHTGMVLGSVALGLMKLRGE